MINLKKKARNGFNFWNLSVSICLPLLFATSAMAQSPVVKALEIIEAEVNGPIIRLLALIGIAWGGITLVFVEGHHARVLGGLLFGIGIAVGAVQILSVFFGR